MMTKTKQKILDTSLALFNEFGLSKVPLRRIATHMGISQGNLNYHFKKREDIIEGLYYQLVLNINQSIANVSFENFSIHGLYQISTSIAYEFYKFRFFLLDFTQIMREQEQIKQHYNQLLLLRKSQMIGLINSLVAKELVRPEELPNEYENLYTRVQILSDFWMSSLSIQQNTIEEKEVYNHTALIFENIYPYLTEKGKIEFLEITAKTDKATLKKL
ncbi:TetR/AcrR family transcriptional regulator [Wenyingzhuangia sp. IMCC45574]